MTHADTFQTSNFSGLWSFTLSMPKRSVAYIALCCFLSSCAGGGEYVYRTEIEEAYVANKMHVPFFSKAGQTQLEASMSDWFQCAGGYSINDYIASVASVRFMNPSSSDSNFHHNRFFDLGVGYFMRNEEPQRLEAFVRIGKGYTNVIDQYDRSGKLNGDTTFRLGFFSYDYIKYSLQVNAGWEWEHWVIGASARGGYMHMRNVSRLIKTLPDEAVITNSNLSSLGSTFFDFGFTARYMVIEQIGIELQMIFGQMNEVIGFESLQSSSASYRMASFSIVGKF